MPTEAVCAPRPIFFNGHEWEILVSPTSICVKQKGSDDEPVVIIPIPSGDRERFSKALVSLANLLLFVILFCLILLAIVGAVWLIVKMISRWPQPPDPPEKKGGEEKEKKGDGSKNWNLA